MYEKLLGVEAFDSSKKEGCDFFSTTVGGVKRQGYYCICSEELCNKGPIEWPKEEEAEEAEEEEESEAWNTLFGCSSSSIIFLSYVIDW